MEYRGSEDQQMKERYAEIIERTKELPPLIAKQVQWTNRALRTLSSKPPEADPDGMPITFHASQDRKNWNDTGDSKPYVIKAPGALDQESDSTHSSDLFAPGVDPPSRRKFPTVPQARGIDLSLAAKLENLTLTGSSGSLSVPTHALGVGGSEEPLTGRSTKRSRGDTGRPTPRDQRAAAQVKAEEERLEEREKLAMKDAQEKVEFKP